MAELDLKRFGVGVFRCKGTIWNKRLDGSRLLLLFGERHSIKPFIRESLMNAFALDKLGVLACVGVEGHPGKDVPGNDAREAFEAFQAKHPGDDEKIAEGVLRAVKSPDFYFWKTLVLMRPALMVQSVDDAALCDQADGQKGVWALPRWDCIVHRLRNSELFECDANTEVKERQLQAKADLQVEQEWAEHPVNVARDEKLLENLLALWDRSGISKIAILNAGSSHQWRIARKLPSDVSYYHIEQP